MRIILASKSPRRRELLAELFSSFEIIVEETDEILENGIHPRDGVELLAVQKGKAVLNSNKLRFVGELIQKYDETQRKVGDKLLEETKNKGVCGEYMIISSDTLVEIDGVPLGKPYTKENAIKMLNLLSGKAHNVHTGVAIHYKDRVFSGVASSQVVFKNLTEKEIVDYVNSGEPMDKAGAYAIQGLGGELVSGYVGDFDTIVGLSTRLTLNLIEEALKI